MLTERDGVGVLVCLRFISQPGHQVSCLVAWRKLDLSDKRPNNYTTDSFQILSPSPFIARISFRAITIFSDSVAKQRPQGEHDAQTQHQNVWTHTKPTAFTKLAEIYKMKGCGISVGDTQQLTKSFKNKFLWTASVCAVLQWHTFVLSRRQLVLKRGISEKAVINTTDLSSFCSENGLYPHNSKALFTSVIHSQSCVFVALRFYVWNGFLQRH